MKANMTEPGSKQDNDARDIPKWTRRYAENRTLPIVIHLVIILVLLGAIGGLSYLWDWGWHSGERWGQIVAAVLLSAVIAWAVWYRFVGSVRVLRRISGWFYRSEGNVSVLGTGSATASATPAGFYLFLFWALTCGLLGLALRIPLRYMQPLTALMAVPFMVYWFAFQRGASTPLMLLWPTLYAAHAIAVVADAPIYFGDEWEALNILIPVVGYGVIAALAAHIYSRYALRRLRTLAQSPDTTGGGQR